MRPLGPGLTEHELTIMHIIWEASLLTVADILERFPRKPKPAYTSLLTAVRALEKKGFLKHEKAGKAYLYGASVSKAAYTKSFLRKAVDSLFGGRPADLAINLLKQEKLSLDEIRQLKSVLETFHD